MKNHYYLPLEVKNENLSKKLINKLALLLAVILLPFASIGAGCVHTISLTDSYGDGWNGGKVNVQVNGITVLSSITLASGAGPLVYDFNASLGDDIAVVYTSGSWAGENYFEVFDGQGTELTVGGGYQSGWRPYYEGNWNGMAYCSNGPPPPPTPTFACSAIYGGSTVDVFPQTTDFENSANISWWQCTSDNFNWTRKSGYTGSSQTGPSSAAAGSYYYYIESSSPNYSNKNAVISQQYDFSNFGSGVGEMSFDYHMHGSSMGSLQVYIDGIVVWSKTGQQHIDETTPWSSASIDLAPYLGGQCLIEIKGTTSTSYRGDAAIDNLIVTAVNPCSGTPIGGNATFTTANYCDGTQGTCTVSGMTSGLSYVWEMRTNGGAWTPTTVNATTSYLTLGSDLLELRYKATCASNGLSGYSNIVGGQAAVVTPASAPSRCGSGSVSFSATVNSPHTVQWYSASSGGSPLQQTNSYSPNISSTTSDYVASSG
jgi:hypothetical protein